MNLKDAHALTHRKEEEDFSAVVAVVGVTRAPPFGNVTCHVQRCGKIPPIRTAISRKRACAFGRRSLRPASPSACELDNPI